MYYWCKSSTLLLNNPYEEDRYREVCGQVRFPLQRSLPTFKVWVGRSVCVLVGVWLLSV